MARKKTERKLFTLELEDDLLTRLRDAATRRGWPMTQVVREAIKKSLEP